MKETKFKNTEIGEIPEDWEDVINPIERKSCLFAKVTMTLFA